MFLSIYENKLDKKGRVSVPAQYRSHLSNLGYNGIICYSSFNYNCIEAWPQDRIEKIAETIDNLKIIFFLNYQFFLISIHITISYW